MKIVHLISSNIKKITAVDITPSGNIVEITGENGEGKSSVLDSIEWALGGIKRIQDEPIRRGEQEGSIFVDTGDYKITRTFHRAESGGFTSYIKVENKDGAKFPSPQTLLDTLYNAISFDPLEFVRMKPKEQAEILKRFVVGVDLEKLAAHRTSYFDARTVANRDLARTEAAFNSIIVPEGAPENRVVIGDLMAAINIAEAGNRENLARAGRMAGLKTTINRLEKELLDARADLENCEEPKPLVDIEPLRIKLNEADALNSKFDAAEWARGKRMAAAVEIAGHRNESDGHTKKIAEIDKQVTDAIAAAKFPVKGLALDPADATRVIFKGVPFDQASQAEQLRASMAIAASMNPKLKIALIRQGAFLDKTSMGLLGAAADALDIQVWVESIQSDRAGAIVIEDGAIARINGAVKK